MFKRRVTLFTINVIFFFVFAELFSLVIYFFQNGEVFYLHRKSYKLIPETNNQALTFNGLHPYFGPTHRPGAPFIINEDLRDKLVGNNIERLSSVKFPEVATNNFGFFSPYDYPYIKKSDNQFIIAIFGGSVGVWFCQLGTNRLTENLKQNNFFKDKEFIILCFSHEGYKQPQQLLILSYFLSIGQQFDLVINIDGYNEIALSSLNNERGLDISMPSFQHVDPLINLTDQSTLTPEKLNSLAKINNYKTQLNTLAQIINNNPLASLNFVLEQSYKIISNNYQVELVNFDTLRSNPSKSSLIYVTPKVKDRGREILFEDIAKTWVSSTILMNELLAAQNIAYFHFLQPNQYYTIRVFGDYESNIALSNESPHKDNIKKGYPFLIKASIALKNKVNFFDGTDIFDDESSPVYMDSCCHYTLLGNEILADFMANSILNSKGIWQNVTN